MPGVQREQDDSYKNKPARAGTISVRPLRLDDVKEKERSEKCLITCTIALTAI